MTAYSSSHRSASFLVGRVIVEDLEQGIRSIRLIRDPDAAPEGPDAIAQLHDALAAAAAHEGLKVVLLSGLGELFSGGDRALADALIERGTVAALSAFPCPLIAELPGDGLGPALLLAALCDIVVCSETGRYGWPTEADGAGFPTPAEYALAEARFGPAFAAELLTTGRARTGLALRDGHWCCPVVADTEVAPHARALAAQLADKSRDALLLLKPHLARTVRERGAALTIAAPAIADAAQAVPADAAQAAVPKTLGKHLAVRDEGGGVLTLTLRRGGKKHDTRAMAQDLQTAFAHAAIRAGHRAIILVSEYPGFLPESDAVADDALLALMRALADAPLPVVAIAGAVPGARAWLALQCCDAVIHQEDGHYDASPLLASTALAGPAARLFALRLGTGAARELLLTGAGRSGAALVACSPALHSVPRAQAVETALARALGWARWPQSAVLAWKAARAVALADALEDRADQAESSSDGVAETPVVSPTPMTLASSVVSATLHPGGIAEVVMQDRASKNMLSPALVEGLAEVFAQLSASPACKVVVLTGYDTYFCSGGTREALRAIQEGKVVFTDDRTFRLPLDCPVPVIAAMQGHGIGAGLSLGLFCDFPLLSEESHYVSPYMTYGFTPGVGATLIVPERFGTDLARETLLTACECEGIALPARGVSLPVLPRAALRDAAMALAGRLARLPRAGLARMKRHLNQSVRDRLDEVCAQELAMHDATFVGRADTLARIETAFGRGEDTTRTTAAAPVHTTASATGEPVANVQASVPVANAAPAPAARMAEEIPLHAIRDTLLHMLARELHLDDDEVDADRQYTDLGLDSITGVTWIRKVNERYGLSLDATIVYTYPTIAKLAQHVKSLVGSRDARQATPDFAELETRKLLAFGTVEPVVAAPRIALSAVDAGVDVGAVAAAPAPVALSAPAPVAGELSLGTIRDTLQRMLARELHLDDDEVDPDRQYTDLGLDSITGVTWIRKVNERHGLSLDATIVYTYPTIAKLAQHVKSLVDSRDAHQATPDFAELETRKLLSFGAAEPVVAAPRIALAEVAVAAAAPSAPVAPVSGDVPLRTIRDTLQRMLARELHLDEDEVDPDRQYTDLGLDSITGVTWIRKVNERHGLSLDATIVYTYPTIAKLAQHVKSLVDSRDAQQATPDFAELETRKLRAFAGDPVPSQGGGLVLSNVEALSVPTTAPVPVVSLAPVVPASTLPASTAAASSEIAVRETMLAPFRQLTSWRRGQAALPAGETTQAQAPRVPEDIAVIGMAGQFPMARDIDAFWENLRAGVDGIRELAPDRWDLSAWYQPGEPTEGKTNSKWLGQLEDYDRFDPLFFNISPAEARAMDPQQRMFLQTCWRSIEHAGYDPRSLGGSRCGVFVGAAANDYGDLSRRTRLSAYGFTGNASSILAARIAYLLDLQGPCITIDTACSASLVAIANACDSLSLGSSDLALAGGVYIGAGPTMHIMTAQSGMLSTDGRCYTFDHRANGFVPGEAVGVVMLKRLADAERDGDRIHAVVRGWGVNQDGRTNGITAPNPASQTRLMQEVYRRHRIDPAEIQLIEAHGTGTPLGDPIEIRGLIDAFGPSPDAAPYCALGSVKSNIGHCLTAAGVTAFIKAVLAVAHRELPPTIHFERLNPHIRLEGTPFYVNTALQPWTPRGDARRHAAVSSFGYSGTNAHIVIGEYTGAPRRPATQLPPAFIVPLSAKTPAQLTDIVRDLLTFVRRHGDEVALADLAYTLQVGRAAMEERLGFVVDSMAQLADRLQGHLDGRRDLPESSAGQVQKHRESLSLIDQDEEFREALLERWMAQRKYPQLLKLWAKGMALDWNRLYVDRPQRIALPTYPFARERYWIDTPDALPATTAVAATTTAMAPVASPEAPAHLFFEERWVEDTAAVPSSSAAGPVSGGVVLIAPVDSGWTLPGAVRIDAVAALAEAVDEAAARSGGPVSVVCTTAAGRGRDGIHQLFDLFRRIKGCEDRVRHVLLVGLHDPARAEGVWDTSWIGFERSLRTAMPSLRVSLLFTDGRTDAGPRVGALLRDGGIVAYRDGRRHVLSLDRVAAPAGASSPRLKQHGHYLITGGSGALGGLFARFLAETCQADLTLLGRRPASETIARQLAELRAAGARSAEYVSLDITDGDAVAAWARTLATPLTGVIHAAGVSRMQRFDEKTDADLDAVLGPKTTATIALDVALRDQPLDVVCYFSSSSAILGDTGACDYAVANRFLMAYAEHRAHAGLPGKTLVINWPLWDAATSGGTGMGPETSAQTAFYLKSSGQSALSGPDGLRLWQDLLAEDRVQTLVLYGQPSRVVPFLDRLYAVDAAASPAAIAAPAPAPARMAGPASASGDWRVPLRDELRRLIAGALELAPERLDDETNLADYGFDSIGLTALAKQLQAALSVEVTPALFFNRPNVQGLIDHFAAEFPAHFAARYRVDDVPQAPVAQPVSPTTSLPSTPSVSVPTVVPVIAAPVVPAQAGTGSPVAAANGATSRVAIVGMSGRFPKADDVDAFWTLLAEGRSGVDDVPPSRWNWREYFVAPGHRENRIHARRGGFLDGMDTFDPLFFEVSPAEAEEMDPSERLLMMEAYRAIEDAGIAPSSLRGRNVGVFVGMEESQYSMVTEAPGVTTLGAAMISSRLSYFLDLRGPALATNTACSSGLVALHQAVSSLQQGECEAALAASVALSLSPKPWMKMSEAGMLSPDGLCRSFSKHADGIGIGEAVVAVLLMPLQAALDRGLPVYGVIRGSGTNFDGKTNGVTAPNGRAQEQLIETVYTRHGIDARDVSHVIAHGTGTRLGDPVELNALHNAFRTLAQQAGDDGKSALPCAVTSVKSNLGHTMAASGLVSLVALLQGLAHRQIPASLHCEEDNDYIAWRDSRLYVNKTTRAWDVPGDRLRLGAVSAFGRSGTNAHVVIEEFRDPRPLPSTTTGACLVPLSARTTEQLRQRVEDLLAFLKRTGTADLAAVARTLRDGRDALPQRLAVIATSCAQLRRELEDWLDGKPSEHVATGSADWRHAVGRADAQSRPALPQRHETLLAAAEAWVRGGAIEGVSSDAVAQAPCLHLPTYPFAQDRYWIDDAPASPAPSRPVAARGSVSLEDILDQVDAGTLAGGDAAAAVKTMSGSRTR